MLNYIIAHWAVILAGVLGLMTDISILFPSLATNPIYNAINSFLKGIKGGQGS